MGGLEDAAQTLRLHEVAPVDPHETKPKVSYGVLPSSLPFQNLTVVLLILYLSVELDDDRAVVPELLALEKRPNLLSL